MRLLVVGLAVAVLMPIAARAQGTPPRPPASATPARIPAGDSLARRDSLRLADTTRIDTTTVKWAEPDSIMKALIARPGYDVTKFQGNRATYDAGTKNLRLDADSAQRAAVDKEGQVAVSDSSIYFNQTTGDVTNLGHYIISMPGGNEAPIRGFGQVTYNSNDRSAVFTNANLPINNGDMWYLHIKTGGAQVDSTKPGAATIYIEGLRMTSCPDSVPDYYFDVKTAKRTSTNTVIGRNVTLVVGDIPVLWLPFIFQNVHGGRTSGLLTTKVGISDIIKNSPSYHRDIENLGYYWAMNDYMDGKAWIDWRSGAGGSPALDPGRFTTNVDYEYSWLNQFLSGDIGGDYTKQGDGQTNLHAHWQHGQQFSHNGQLRLDINFVTSTVVQRRNTFDPALALATISSSAQYSRQFGPATLSIGGTRRQYPGRPQVDQDFPTLTLSTSPLNLGSHVTWTPSFSFAASQSTHIDQQGQFQFRYTLDSAGRRDSTEVKQSSSKTSITFASPLKLFNQDFGNSFSLSSSRINFPQQFTIRDVTTGDSVGTRIYNETYTTGVDWTPTFQLPPLGQNRFNLSPVIGLANVDGGPFWIASERTNGRFVSQSKRLTYGLNASPTLYARFSGFGPLAMFRHSITPTFGYTYAPASHVDTAYLAATGRVQKGYLGNIALNQINFGVSTVLEAKVATRNDTTSQAQKLKVLSLTMSPFSYNLSRLHDSLITSKAWWRGLTTERFTYSLRSDLLPGIEFSSDYSLFQGSTTSDTAIFKPYREGMSASLNLSRDQNPLTVLAGLFGASAPPAQHVGAAPPLDTTQALQSAASAASAGQPAAPTRPTDSRIMAPLSQGWRLSLTLSSSRPRPPVGGNPIAFNPVADCARRFQGNQVYIDQCVLAETTGQGTPNPITSLTQGGPVYILPTQTNIAANLGFSLTPKWTVGWNTNYDFVRHDFASHVVTLQRDLHDWTANFNFSQSPNGNFSFSFSIGLKAQHDLKFDYARNSVRSY